MEPMSCHAFSASVVRERVRLEASYRLARAYQLPMTDHMGDAVEDRVPHLIEASCMSCRVCIGEISQVCGYPL